MSFYRKYEKAILASTKASEIESSRPRFIQVFCFSYVVQVFCFNMPSRCFVFTCGKIFCFRMIVKSSQHRYVQVFCFNMQSRCFVLTCRPGVLFSHAVKLFVTRRYFHHYYLQLEKGRQIRSCFIHRYLKNTNVR
jgi:hypothetical protein